MGELRKLKKIIFGNGLGWLIKKRLFNKSPAYVELIPLLRCNLNWKKCHQKEIRRKLEGKGELDYEKIFNIVKNLKKFGVRKISFLGGEIMLMKDIWKILDLFEREGIFFDLGTNGTLVRDEHIEKLAKYNNLFSINLSLDGFEKTHDEIRGLKGSWRKALETILKLRNAGVNAGAVLLLQKSNINEMPKLVEFLAILGIIRVQIMLEGQTTSEAIKKTKKISPELECDLIRSDLGYSFKELTDALNQLRNLTKKFKKLQLGLPEKSYIKYFYEKGFRKNYWVTCGFMRKKSFVIDWNGNLDFCCFFRRHNPPNLTKPLKKNPFNDPEVNLSINKAKRNNLFPVCERCFMIEKVTPKKSEK